MFIRRELAVSLSLLFVLSLFFPLKTVMAASPVAPVPAPPAVVGADSDKQPSAPPAVPSGDNKQQGASPSPAVPKAEAGLSQEPKQVVSPEAEQKKPEAQQPSVAAPPAINEEKKNDLSAAKVQVPAQVKAAGAELGADADLPPWREKLDEADVEKMAGCEAIADHEHKQIIIRPKNGAKEGVIYMNPSISSFGAVQPFHFRLYDESMAMLAVIQATEGYTLKFEKRIYLFKNLALGKPHMNSFFNPVPMDEKYDGRVFWTENKGDVEFKAIPSTLASLGNIADVNTNFLNSLWYFLAHTRIGTKDLNILAKKKYPASVGLNNAFKYMKGLTGYADFSSFQAGTDEYILDMCSAFKGAGTDDFVLNFSNKKLYFKDFDGALVGVHPVDTFKDFKGVLIANNWKDSYKGRRGKIRSAFGSSGAYKLFGVKKKDAEKGYSLSSLVVTDNPELLKIRKNSKYYKKITLSYLEQQEELELPAIYDSRITPTGENDTNQPASADYMKIVKYQVDKAIQAKVAEIKRKCGLPDNFPLEAVPTKAISSTPTSLFQEYKIDYPQADVQMEAQPLEQTVYEGQEINKIKITVTSQKEENLPTFAFDQAWQTELAKIGLKFTPAAPDPNNRKVLAAGTISGIIKDNSLQQELDSKGAKTYQIKVTGKTTSGKEIKCEQILKITVTRQIATGNKPETSSTLSAYLILAGTLSVILTGRNLAKK